MTELLGAATAAASGPAPVVAAVATCAAAVFSALSLIVAGRREQRKWRRDSLVEALVDFIGGSFAGGGQRVLDARRRGEPLDGHRASTEAAHGRQTESLTRLRLIAPAAVVVAAERLHEADHAVHDAALDGPVEDPEPDRWARLRQDQARARESLLDSARRSLREGAGPPVRHRHHPPSA